MAALLATWHPDRVCASLRDDDDGLWATLTLVDDWYMSGDRVPVSAWVVEWLDRSGEESRMVRTRLDEVAEPPADDQQMSGLIERAAAVARGLPPEEPDAFGRPLTGLTVGTEVHTRIELISHAIQHASGRLDEAARVTEPWGSHRVLISLTETISWIRALDDAMKHVWRSLTPDALQEVTGQIDAALERPGWDSNFVARAKATKRDSGYPDWTLGLMIRSVGLPREELMGLRWLAGKLLHFGPLPAVELRQWRAGAAPRWKWRSSADVFPVRRAERGAHDREAYDRHLAGRDVIGTFNLFDPLLAAEFLAFDVTGRSER